MIEAAYTRQFKKDFKRCVKRGLDISELEGIVQAIIEEAELPSNFRAHKLKGNYDGFWEGHIRPDWLLIYLLESGKVTFTRTGTHSDLFDE